MAMDRDSVRPDRRVHGSDERWQRWQRTWSHREQLLKVARRRSLNAEDAEDAVHEAMVRAVEASNIDDERLGAWLTTVTMRLCVDRYRQVDREARDHPRLFCPGPVPVEEAVCDRDEARWLAGRSGELPARQAEALRLKSQDLDVGQVAGRMGLSYEAVESLLARARRSLRNSLAGTLSAVALSSVWGRMRDGMSAPALTAASATLAVLGAVVVPHVQEPPPHGLVPPAAPAGGEPPGRAPEKGHDASHGPDDAAGGPARLAAGRTESDPADLTGLVGGLPRPLPEVPETPSPGVEHSVPLPEAQLPDPGRHALPGHPGTGTQADGGSGADAGAGAPSSSLPSSPGTSGSTDDAPGGLPPDAAPTPDAPTPVPELP